MTPFSLTVIVDNKAAEGLVAEHGYSLYIEAAGDRILLDTGEQNALLPNCEALGVNLDEIDHLVISHGHYDHTGGIAAVVERSRDVDIYLHSAAFQPRYSLDGERPVLVKMGLGAMASVMHHRDDKVHWLTKPMSISDKVGITGAIPRTWTFEDTGGNFYLDPDAKHVDTIRDDAALWLHGKNGLIICLGCCHSGLLNTIDFITENGGEKKIDTIIGGMHLLHADEQRLASTAEALNRYEIGKIVACHCSGDEAVRYLAEHLNCKVQSGYAGLRLEF